MTAGNLMVYLSLILTIIGIVFSLLRLKTKDPRFSLYLRLNTLILFVIISLATVYLYFLFITSDLSTNYVWTYSSTTLPLIYKISGVLAGKAGSLLFWIWMSIIPWFYQELMAHRRNIDDDIVHWTRLIVFIAIAVLLVVLIQHDIFGLTPPDSLNLAPDGNGLSPLLQTELMAIHPPIVFVAYGFLVMPFASGLANLITGDKKWVDMSLNWGRLGWFFLTLGIGLGGLWAYVVLGWGGYWAWDPVETSSLLPWILLTGALHAQLMFKRKGDYQFLAPIIGIMTYLLVIFATFATRAGGLWVSVHTFGEADLSVPAWTRFIDILAENPTLVIYMMFIIVTIILTVILALYRHRKIKGEKKERYYTLTELISDNILMTVMVYLTIVTTIVTLIILIKGVNGLGPDEFNAQVGVLVYMGVLLLIMCLIWRDLGRRNIMILTGLVITASVIGFVLFPDSRAMASSAPLLIVALVGTIYRVMRSVNIKRVWKSMRPVSAHIIHLAVVLILIGYTSSTFMVTETDVTTTVVGGSVEVQGYTLTIENFESTSSSAFLEVEVWKGNSFIGRVRPGVQLIDGQLRNEIMVADTLFEDIYIIYNYDQVSMMQGNVDLHVKILPMMKALWGGMWLMAIGIVLRLLADRPGRRSKRKSEQGERAESEEGEKAEVEDYETRLEKELEDMDGPPEDKQVMTDKDAYEARLEEELNNTDVE